MHAEQTQSTAEQTVTKQVATHRSKSGTFLLPLTLAGTWRVEPGQVNRVCAVQMTPSF